MIVKISLAFYFSFVRGHDIVMSFIIMLVGRFSFNSSHCFTLFIAQNLFNHCSNTICMYHLMRSSSPTVDLVGYIRTFLNNLEWTLPVR